MSIHWQNKCEIFSIAALNLLPKITPSKQFYSVIYFSLLFVAIVKS